MAPWCGEVFTNYSLPYDKQPHTINIELILLQTLLHAFISKHQPQWVSEIERPFIWKLLKNVWVCQWCQIRLNGLRFLLQPTWAVDLPTANKNCSLLFPVTFKTEKAQPKKKILIICICVCICAVHIWVKPPTQNKFQVHVIYWLLQMILCFAQKHTQYKRGSTSHIHESHHCVEKHMVIVLSDESTTQPLHRDRRKTAEKIQIRFVANDSHT